ncbi:MAG: hypothetical protein ACRDK9_11280, partial [Solirubrobacterales bacterium]
LDAERPPGPSHVPPAPAAGSVAIGLAAVACAAVAAGWMVPTLTSLAGGMDRADTLWYHMPLSTRFAEGGELGAIDYFDPIFFASYYPANSEVLHALPILAFDRDILSPLLNLGFLALGLLAAYCIGRPWGLGPHALIGGAIALGSQQLVEFQAGEALNDVVGTSFVLASVAVLVTKGASAKTEIGAVGGSAEGAGRKASTSLTESAQPRAAGAAALAAAGVAAGLAAGTKLSFLAPVSALFVGVTLIAGRQHRLRTAATFAIPALLAGGYWYARNLFATGNPIPFTSFGPLGLPEAERAFELREPFSVAHYWNDLEVWDDWFVPGLEESFGVLWPLTLLAFLGAGAYALWRGATPLLRLLGAVVLVTAVAYVFTPLTAAGEEGAPIAFEWNVRYLAPAAAIGLAILPIILLRRQPNGGSLPDREQNPPLSPETPSWVPAAVLGGLAILLATTVASLVQWQQGHVKGAVAAGVAVLAGASLGAYLKNRDLLGPRAPRTVISALATLGAVGALAAGWWEQNHFLERRYENLSPQLRLADAVRWARDLRDARVAVAGVRGVFNQYPFYGTDLSNEVQWLGIEGDDGAYLRIPTCERWREELGAGDYTHVVTTYDPFNPGTLTDTKEALWTRRDPAAREVLRDGPVSVFALDGEPDPAACAALPDLTPPELNGDSVNIEPTANQPR